MSRCAFAVCLTALVAAFAVSSAPAEARPLLMVSDTPVPNAESSRAALDLGARASRVIVDPNRPLRDYDDAVRARADQGLRVHIHLSTLRAAGDREMAQHVRHTAAVARAAVRRWDPIMLTAVNEPDLVGVPMCDLARMHRALYKQVKREDSGVYVPFGEYAPLKPITFAAKIAECNQPRVVADGFSVHPYDFGLGGEVSEWEGTPAHVGYLKAWLKRRSTRRFLATPRGGALPVYWTEYGVPLKDATGNGDTARMARAADRMTYTIQQAEKHGVKVLTLHHMSWEHNEDSNWFNTAILGPAGERTPVFYAIREARN